MQKRPSKQVRSRIKRLALLSLKVLIQAAQIVYWIAKLIDRLSWLVDKLSGK